MADGKTVKLRPVTGADEDFLVSLYASTRSEELARVPWTAQQKDAFVLSQFAGQKRHYVAEHPHASHEVICADATAVGRLYLDRSGAAFHILDITILPECRNAGTGSFILRQVMNEAASAAKPVTIYVESYNPSLRLFERLGFQRADENGFHLLLKKMP